MQSSTTKLILIILTILVLAGVVVFAAQSGVVTSQDDVLSFASQDADKTIQDTTQEINTTLAQFRNIQSIEISDTLFTNAVFQELRDTAIQDLRGYGVGRENPYLLIGQEEVRQFDDRFQRLLDTRRFGYGDDVVSDTPVSIPVQGISSTQPEAVTISNSDISEFDPVLIVPPEESSDDLAIINNQDNIQ